MISEIDNRDRINAFPVNNLPVKNSGLTKKKN